LFIHEALDLLGLRPGATASEIKEAYRDMVKVWHPDRFGNDLRLRQKAERQLKLINEAYRVLRSNADANSGVRGMHATESEKASDSSPHAAASSAAPYGRRYSGSPIPHRGPGSGANGMGMRWMYRGLGISLILLVGYFVTERDRMRGAQPSRYSIGRHSPGIPDQQPLEASRGAHVVHSTDGSGLGGPGMAVEHSKESSPRQFRVRSLSAAETGRLETLCSRQKELWGQVAYQSCLKAQLDMMTNPAGKPDMSTLSEAERESIESVCSEARRYRGPEGRNRCETEQVASLAAEPARPDLSTLKDADRHSIESACISVRNREGPAAYNRCLDRMMRTLAEAR
jgi:hypothetical protein